MQPCQLLEDYLDHDLTGTDLSRFIDHLLECTLCRQAVADHKRLQSLLTEASARLEPIPEKLVPRIESRVKSARRRRIAGTAAALAATAAALWLLTRYLPQRHGPAPSIATNLIGLSPPPGPKVADSVRVSFPHDANLFFVRENSDSPNVTVVHVYSGLWSPPHRSRNRASDSPERSDE